MEERLPVREERAVLKISTGNLAVLGCKTTDCLKANNGMKPRTTFKKCQ
jgi:hypothetical protein